MLYQLFFAVMLSSILAFGLILRITSAHLSVLSSSVRNLHLSVKETSYGTFVEKIHGSSANCASTPVTGIPSKKDGITNTSIA